MESTLPHSPIVEAIIDIDCDLPSNLDFKQIEQAAKDALQDLYPNVRHRMFQGQSITPKDKQTVTIDFHQGLQAIQFQSKDKKQLIQFRPAGYSFNRLSPYEGLDKYLPEIKRTWESFVDIVHPVKIRKIGLRNINRILLPLNEDNRILEDYLAIGPKPPCQNLILTGFLNQHVTIEPETGHQVNILMSTQSPEDGKLPLILDIDAFSVSPTKNLQWEVIDNVIHQLRNLKNNVFESTLTKKCLTLFSHQQS
jgi:uncharacterized protein (TIGR04255 family)